LWRLLQLEHELGRMQPFTRRQRRPLIIHRRQELPGGAIRKYRFLIVTRNAHFNIFVVAALFAKPCDNRPATTKPPAVGEIGQETADGVEFGEGAGWVSIGAPIWVN
jgi:hypothetical protein